MKVGELNLNLDSGTPTLDVRYQKAVEKGGTHSVRDENYKYVAGEGDKVKFSVSTAGDEPRYLYVYWYDADGKPERLWPATAEPGDQTPQTTLTYPQKRNAFRGVDASKGSELVLAFVSDKALTQSELEEFEKQRPYRAGEVVSPTAYEIAPEPVKKEIHRGLGGIVEAREGVLSADFEEALNKKFSSYDGIVIPHK